MPQVFRGSQALAEGLLTPRQLRGDGFRRLLRDVYAPAWAPVTHALRCRGAGLVLHPTAQITGTSMATVLGVDLSQRLLDVTAVIPNRSQQERFSGIDLRRVSAPLDRGSRWETAPLADPRRMAFDLAARVSLPDGVARLDAVVRAGLVRQPELTTWLEGRRDNDIQRVREAVALIDPRAESLPESIVRVHLVQAGFEVEPQFVVVHRGVIVARLDLALVWCKVAVEYDGAWHALREQLERDRRRLMLLREAGWVVVHVTASMLGRPDEITDAVRRAIRVSS